MPERIGVTYSEPELASQPLLALLERSGVSVERATQEIGAVLASPEVAGALEIEIGSALIALTRVVYDDGGQGVEHLHALYRPDRYAFRMDLERTGGSGGRRWSPVRLSTPSAIRPSGIPAPARKEEESHDETYPGNLPPWRARLRRRRDRRHRRAGLSSRGVRRR